jgi:hypothetical protein
MEGRVLGFFARHGRHAGRRGAAQRARQGPPDQARCASGELLQAQEPASDRRQVRLSLTPTRRVQQALQQQAQALEQRALAGLDQESARSCGRACCRCRPTSMPTTTLKD